MYDGINGSTRNQHKERCSSFPAPGIPTISKEALIKHAKGSVATAKRIGDREALSSSPQPEPIRHHLPELLLQAEHIIARS